MTRLFALRGADQYLSGFFACERRRPGRTKKLGKRVRTQTCPHWLDAPRPDMFALPMSGDLRLGYVIVGIFVAAWLLSYAIYRLNRYDEIEVYPA
jgi:hypothetical protein